MEQSGKARTKDLGQLGFEIHNRQQLYGEDNVTIGWDKAPVGIEENQIPDEVVKVGAAK